MQSPLRISYHHCEPSEPLNALIKEKAAELEHFYPRITSCRVVVERPGYHHRQGKGAHFLRIYPDQGFGFLETADGREVYFHRSSVLNGGFDRLAIGTEVRFAEEPGEKGPQASTVQPVGESGHHEFPEPD